MNADLMLIVYKRQNLYMVIKHHVYTKTWKRKQPFMKRI